MCDAGPMAQTICVIISTATRERLQAIVGTATGNRSMWNGRASCWLRPIGDQRSGLPSASASVGRRCGGGSSASPRRGSMGCCVTRRASPAKAPIPAETTARVVGLTCTQPPHQATHWTGRAMAKATGLSLRSVQRIWQSHQLQPHRIRTFKHSRDIRPLPPNSLTSLGSMSIPQPMLWCSRLMKRARSRRLTAPGQGCRSNRGAARP